MLYIKVYILKINGKLGIGQGANGNSFNNGTSEQLGWLIFGIHPGSDDLTSSVWSTLFHRSYEAGLRAWKLVCTIPLKLLTELLEVGRKTWKLSISSDQFQGELWKCIYPLTDDMRLLLTGSTLRLWNMMTNKQAFVFCKVERMSLKGISIMWIFPIYYWKLLLRDSLRTIACYSRYEVEGGIICLHLWYL